ncbi:hypothetical protein [Clostridium sp. DJ247]|uniref:hypothetical protein n=1 Tax=Clostridium sp. DJ247 TaxID=2726188 RepID=UPI0016284499|nr:hypothetical protein [Clostridium sp. DJ247]MBC2581389.1 hypothetical protein [Clostridium sp. DJ247]
MDLLKNPLEFKDLYKKAFKKNPLFDGSKIEVKLAMAFTIVSLILLWILLIKNNDTSITSILLNLMLYIGSGLISMLGFIISGLAIASGTINNKIAHRMNIKGKFDSILAILFSFYYIGRVIGLVIICYFLAYIVVSIDLPIISWLYFIVAFILAYGFLFSVFYSVSLLKTCLNLFVLNYKYWFIEQSEEKSEENFADAFNSVRIDTLTKILLEKGIILDKDSFQKKLKETIDKDYDGQIKNDLLKKTDEYY